MRLVVHVGRPVLTCDEAGTVAVAIAVAGDRIVAVGDVADLRQRVGGDVELVEHDGAIVPGFLDSHHHLALTALYEAAVDCGPALVSSLAELRARLAGAACDRDGRDGWVIAAHFDATRVRERRLPTLRELDAACPFRPLVLMHFGFHSCSLNSRALAELGIDDRTPQPAAGRIGRDRRGALTGALFETASSAVEAEVERRLLERPGFDDRLAARMTRMLAAGLTCVTDAAVSPRVEARYRAMAERRRLAMPVVMLPAGARGVLRPPVDRLGGAVTGERPGAGLLLGHLKLFGDGGDDLALRLPLAAGPRALRSLLGTALRGDAAGLRQLRRFTLRPGADLALHSGIRFLRGAGVVALAREAVERGFALAVHAMGNAAVDDALDLIAQVRPWHRDEPPPRIEHAFLCEERQLRRAADLGVLLSVQPSFVALTDGLESPHPDAPILPLRAAIDRGVTLAFGSDHPVVDFDPLLGIRAAVTRRWRGGRPIHADQAISVEEALIAATRAAAHAAGCLDERGSLEPGKRADFVVLSRDPRGLAGEALDGVAVTSTFLGGEEVSRA